MKLRSHLTQSRFIHAATSAVKRYGIRPLLMLVPMDKQVLNIMKDQGGWSHALVADHPIMPLYQWRARGLVIESYNIGHHEPPAFPFQEPQFKRDWKKSKKIVVNKILSIT